MAQPDKKPETGVFGKIRHYFSKTGKEEREDLKTAKITIGSPPPSVEGLKRALNPPHDDTVTNLHGYEVHDHFRPLENIESEEVGDWVDRQNERFQEYIAGTDEVQKSARDFVEKILKPKAFPPATENSVSPITMTVPPTMPFIRYARKASPMTPRVC